MVSLVRQWRTRRWLSRLWRGRKQGWVNTWQHQNSSRVDETHNTTIKRSIKSISSTYDDFSYKRDSYKILKKTQRNVDMLGRKAEKIQAMHNREICNKGEYWKEEIQEKKEKKMGYFIKQTQCLFYKTGQPTESRPSPSPPPPPMLPIKKDNKAFSLNTGQL